MRLLHIVYDCNPMVWPPAGVHTIGYIYLKTAKGGYLSGKITFSTDKLALSGLNAYICRMANTLSKIYIHIIFAVKGRYSILPTHLLPDIHAYIASTVRQLGHKCVKVGGTENHVHLLIEYNITKLIPDLVHDLKIALSHHINKKHIVMGRFQWQRGYAALSYSKSAIPGLIEYIINQYEHHKGRSLRNEVRLFLDRYEIEYDERYLFDD